MRLGMRLGLLLVLVLGCADDPAPFASLEGSRGSGTLIGRGGNNIFGDAVPTDPEELWLADPTLSGNVGPVSVYDGGRIHDGYVLADYAYVELREAGTAGAMMVAFNITGLDRVVPGTYHFRSDMPSAGDVQISAIGCSGASEDMWTFDRPAEQLDIEVTNGASANELRFEINGQLASYTTEASTVTAGFTLRRPEEAAAP